MMVRLSGPGPLYQQVYRAIRQAILTGELRAGERLPVTRVLAEELGISRNVIVIAYELLIAEGYVNGRAGSGTFVTASVPDLMLQASPSRTASAPESLTTPPPRLSSYAGRIQDAGGLALASPEMPCRYDFAYFLANPDEFPAEIWRSLLLRRMRSADLEYSSSLGDAGLRAEIAHYLRRSRAIQCRDDQILVVNGAQQALDLVARVLLDAGDTVAIEDPHYHGARQAFQAVGARLMPVPVDSCGLSVHRLPQGQPIKLVYLTPSHQFPTGGVMPLNRRLALLEWAERAGAHILEDDYDGEYRYEGRPVEAVQALDRSGRVTYIGTFSRILFPSLRIGYVVMPESLAEPLTNAKWISDCQTSSVQQVALADFIREGHLEALIRRVRKKNVARRRALLEALEAGFGDAIEIRGAAAGSHILVRFRNVPQEQTDALVATAAAAGVRVYSAAPHYLNPPACCELILGYGRMRDDEIRAGVEALCAARYGGATVLPARRELALPHGQGGG